jgi:hypothetical protein
MLETGAAALIPPKNTEEEDEDSELAARLARLRGELPPVQPVRCMLNGSQQV